MDESGSCEESGAPTSLRRWIVRSEEELCDTLDLPSGVAPSLNQATEPVPTARAVRPTATTRSQKKALWSDRILEVVRLPDGRLGIVNNRKLWVEMDLYPSEWNRREANVVDEQGDRHYSLEGPVGGVETTFPRVRLPSLDDHPYGKWCNTSIGGLSHTWRRTGVLRAVRGDATRNKPLVLFALHARMADTVATALRGVEGCTVGDAQPDAEHGPFVTEVVVHRPEDVAHVAARIARGGATPIFEDATLDAKRCIGVERLDRISASVVCDEGMYTENDGVYGLRRGSDNWRFSWLPDGWCVPITWDHMVANFSGCDILDLYRSNNSMGRTEDPLQQHVAIARLRSGRTSCWRALRDARVDSDARTVAVDVLDTFPAAVHTRVLPMLDEPPEWLVEQLPRRRVFDEDPCAVGHAVCACDGTWYELVDTREELERRARPCHRRECRLVSESLSERQTKQLIEAFYFLEVERNVSDEVAHAFGLILYHYMRELGYTARWMGKYVQDAHNVGNGDAFRHLPRLPQYAPHRLPNEVLNRLCTSDGRLVARGSKGTRTKYCTDRARYVPRKRMRRTEGDEDQMCRPV